MAASSRNIMVSLLPEGEKLGFPVVNNELNLSTLRTVFPQASGLKHLAANGVWQVVPVEGDSFLLPLGVESFVVVSGCIDRARSVLTSEPLARQVSTIFGRFKNNNLNIPGPTMAVNASSPGVSCINSRPSFSRKETRTMFRKKLKLPRSKVFRVVFIYDKDLPSSLNKNMILCEGLLTLTDSDDEDSIMFKMRNLLKNSHVSQDPRYLRILQYSGKSLSQPCVATDFKWSFDKIRLTVGQGKLYVMVHLDEMVEQEKGQKVPATHTMEQQTPDAENSDDDFCELGTPTILINRRRHRLKRNATSRNSTPQNQNQVDDSKCFTESNYGELQPSTHQSQNRGNDLKCFSESEEEEPQTSPQQSQNSNDNLKCFKESDDEDRQAKTNQSQTRHDDSKCFLESDDEELQTALAESLRPKLSFQESVLIWRKKEVQEDSDPVLILVHRQKIVDSTRRALKKKGFSFRTPVKVAFSGEDGEDYGGPKREFFSLLIKELRDIIMENGSLCHSVQKLEMKEYYFVGQCITWSILHGGPGFPFFKDSALGMLLEDTNITLTTEDASYEDRVMLKKLQEAESLDQIPVDWLIDQGLCPPFTLENKEELVNLGLKQVLFYRIHAELCQLRDGLNFMGFLDSMREYPDGLRALLSDKPCSITFQELKGMLQCNFSPEGSNDRAREQDAVYALELFLQECCENENAVSIEEVLAFWTGCGSVPVMGFHKKLEVNFVEGVDRLPVAHTCEMSLEISRSVTPETFASKMIQAVQWGGEFHLA